MMDANEILMENAALDEGCGMDDAVIEEAAEEEAVEPAVELQRQIDDLQEQLRVARADREKRERELECLGILEAAGLPSGLASVVQSAEDMAGAVELIRRTVQTKVDAEISRRCRGDAPASGSRVTLSKAELMKLPVAELQRLWCGEAPAGNLRHNFG